MDQNEIHPIALVVGSPLANLINVH